MSSNYYDKLWHLTQQDANILITTDSEQNQDAATTVASTTGLSTLGASSHGTDTKSALQTSIFELYLRYIVIANKLEEVYDKMIQPQKRLLVRRILDNCLGRTIELKHDLVNIDMMEFSYNDEVVKHLNLTPMDTETRIPRYFLRERSEEIEQRKKTTNEILFKLGWSDDSQPEEKMTEIQAIRLIQIHERARQGRLRAHFMKEIRLLKEKDKFDQRDKSGVDSGLMAAMKIQKVWRGHIARRKTRRRKMEEMVLIGMMPPTQQILKQRYENEDKLNKIFEERYAAQSIQKQNLDTSLQAAYDEIKAKYGPSLSENIADEIRNWIKMCYDKTGKIPDLPTEDQGGSASIFNRPGTESEVSRSSARSSKESRKNKDKSKSPARSGDLNANENLDESEGYQPGQSVFLPELKKDIEEFNEIWSTRDELRIGEFPSQGPYEDMIYENKYKEVEREIRLSVDEVMRQEIELLQTAIGKKIKKNNKKTRRSGKKNKKKKEKDLTPDRTTESLYEELVTNGIIRKYPEVRLDKFLGDKALTARNGVNSPSPGDIRQVLKEYAILPLGSDTIRKYSPLIRSLLLVGPTGSGKKTLVHAICTEVGGILFDLTPANIVGKYPGKSGLIMLLHLILKVSRLLQPAVIYMGDAERPFMKKIPKTDRTDPKRLKKDLPKLIKNIAQEDRVLFIGTSKSPWEADQKILQQTYNRFIYIPRPDYGTLSCVWKNLLNDYSGGLATLDHCVMAIIGNGFSVGAVDSSIKEVLTCKRKFQLRSEPLSPIELINSLSSRDCVYREEEEAYQSWWTKTPLGRRYQRALEVEEEAKMDEQAQSAKQGNGKKK